MRIGELAKAVGCHIETVRYYEKIGLIPAPARKPNGYGDYADRHLQYLRLVRRARSLGFAQHEIFELVQLIDIKDDSCDKVHGMVNKQIGALNQKLKEIKHIKKALTQLSIACEQGYHNDCPALDELLRE